MANDANGGAETAGNVPWRAYAMLVLAFVFFAINIIVGRAAHADIPPVGLSFWRWTIAALLLLPFSIRRVRAQWGLLVANWKLLLAMSTAMMVFGNTLVYVGLQSTTALNGGLIPVMRPVLILILAAFLFRGSVTLGRWIGVGIAMVGVALVITRGDADIVAEMQINPGDLWLVLSSVGIAGYQVLVGKMPRDMNGVAHLQASITIGAVLLLPIYLWESIWVLPVTPTWPAVGAVLYVAIFPSIIAVYLMTAGIAAVGPARAAIFNYLQPVFVAAIAVTVLGEAIDWYHPVALGLVAVGVVISGRGRQSGRAHRR